MEQSPALLALNLHHLRYFWMVAREGHLTRTARQLRVSQSALSFQIRQLEEQLGRPLFEREGRSLVLTEAGRVALAYANDVFGAAGQLVATFRDGRWAGDVLRVGSMSTLSRNFQESFLLPAFSEEKVHIQVTSGTLAVLLERLGAHELDVVLANRPVMPDTLAGARTLLLASQPVILVGHAGQRALRMPDDLATVPLLLPTTDSASRIAFDALCSELGIRPRIVAEVDDMALLRLLTRDVQAVALVPAVVVRDELRSGRLVELWTVPELVESFYAVTLERHFHHPLVARLTQRTSAELLLGAGAS
jgi:LysR family transcriptional activator of nhaA